MHETFVGLLRHYKTEDDTVCQIIGFKFQSLYQQQLLLQQKLAKELPPTGKDSRLLQGEGSGEGERVSIESFCTVAAYLLKFKIIDLDNLMPHVSTSFFIQNYRYDTRLLYFI